MILPAPNESETLMRRRRRRARLAVAQRLRLLTGTAGNGQRQSRTMGTRILRSTEIEADPPSTIHCEGIYGYVVRETAKAVPGVTATISPRSAPIISMYVRIWSA